MKFKSLIELYDYLPDNERITTDVLREIITHTIPDCKEKFSFNVPYFYKKRGIAIVWPASVPRGGFKEGVLLGLWQGNKLKDEDKYLKHGTNKKIFYKIFKQPEEIDEEAIIKLLIEASNLDNTYRK